MISIERMIPEILRILQTTGERALGRLVESEEKRSLLVEWCGTGMEILTEQLNRSESLQLLSRVMKVAQRKEQLQTQSFGERLQEISLCLATDVDSIVQERVEKKAKMQEEIKQKILFYEKNLEQMLEEEGKSESSFS